MIIGATPDTDFQILRLSESLYKKYGLRRVFYSAYIPVGANALLPQNVPPPLLREHRLYQTDWLLRFYGFTVNELLDEDHPSLDPLLDPKCNWAVNHLEHFPVEVNRADREVLLRVPGIGQRSAAKILAARRSCALTFEGLKKLGVVLKRAAYFITCGGKMFPGRPLFPVLHLSESDRGRAAAAGGLPLDAAGEQLSLFDNPALLPGREERLACLTGQL